MVRAGDVEQHVLAEEAGLKPDLLMPGLFSFLICTQLDSKGQLGLCACTLMRDRGGTF